MDTLNFHLEKPLQFNWTGKFIAPDENWIHMSRELSDFELILMTKGDLYIAENDTEFVVHEGEYVIICPPCHQHGFRPSQCTFYWTHFSYPGGRSDLRIHETVSSPLSAEETRILLPVHAKVPRMDRMIVLLKQLQDCNRNYRNVNQNNYTLTSILCELYSQLYLSGGRITMKGEKHQLYTDIVDYISWRVREPVKVREVAAYFGYNEKYITTFFKKSAGMSLKSYMLERKMELAKSLLTDTNLPISQIGYDIGFSDNHNFSNAFKKVTGQSPSVYRNTYAERMLFHQ